MAKRTRVPISEARKSLFQLTDMVRSGDDTVVVLEQRGEAQSVALVREARLAYLESRVAELEKRQDRTFQLTGSLTSEATDADLEAVLRELRTEWTPAPAVTRGGARSKRTARR